MLLQRPQKPQLSSVVLPLLLVRDTHLNQPVFGSNNFSGRVSAVPGGNLGSGLVSFKIDFTDGGAIEFARHFARAAAAVRPQLSAAAVLPPQPGCLSDPPAMAAYAHASYAPPAYNPGYTPPPPPSQAAAAADATAASERKACEANRPPPYNG